MKLKELRSGKRDINLEISKESKSLKAKALGGSEIATDRITAAESDRGQGSYVVGHRSWTTYSKRQHIHCLFQGYVALPLQCGNYII
jgi:hypothetical protein